MLLFGVKFFSAAVAVLVTVAFFLATIVPASGASMPF
jgi:hypothetical protein